MSAAKFGVNLLKNRFRNAEHDVFTFSSSKPGHPDFQDAGAVTKNPADGVFRKVPKRRHFGDRVVFFESGHTNPRRWKRLEERGYGFDREDAVPVKRRKLVTRCPDVPWARGLPRQTGRTFTYRLINSGDTAGSKSIVPHENPRCKRVFSVSAFFAELPRV